MYMYPNLAVRPLKHRNNGYKLSQASAGWETWQVELGMLGCAV
jgi:hypothetical protein